MNVTIRRTRQRNADTLQIQQMQHELVGMLRLYAEFCKAFERKVTRVKSDDHVRPRANRRGQNMPVIWVWELQTGNQLLITRDECISRVLVHQHPSTFELFTGQIGTVRRIAEIHSS